jgi:hypothetical protein
MDRLGNHGAFEECAGKLDSLIAALFEKIK